MGRGDFEFLEAARVGDLLYFEKFFANKKSKALQSLRRHPTTCNTQDSSGYSSLHHASLNGHWDIVKILLMHDANPNILDGRGSSPLHLAAWAGHHQICRLLLNSPNAAVGNANVNALTSQRETALHFAAQFGHVKVVATLLENDAAPDFVTLYGETPLDLAAKFGRSSVVQLLVYAFPDSVFYGQVSPLHLAARNGHKSVCEFLLDMNYVDINARSLDGSTPLHESIISGHLAISRALIEQGANCHLRNANGQTIIDLLQQFPKYVIDEFRDFLKNGTKLLKSYPKSDDDNMIYIEDSNSKAAQGASRVTRLQNGHHMPRPEDIYAEVIKKRPSSHVAPPKKPPRRNPNMSKSMDDNMIFGGDNVLDQWHIRLAHDYSDQTSDFLMVSFNPNRRIRRLHFGNFEISTVIKCEDIPTSPTYYDQPPTPTHPPPAPALAERTIFEKLRPLSAEYFLGYALNYAPNIQWEFYFEADTIAESNTIPSDQQDLTSVDNFDYPQEWLDEIREQIQKLLEKVQQELDPVVVREPSDEDRFREWANDNKIAPPLIDHLVKMGYDNIAFLNNDCTKEDILSTINCDAEALDKFLRSIDTLPIWCPTADAVAIPEPSDDHNLRLWLDNLHLTTYYEDFRILAQCKEWWTTLSKFSDEEMRIWLGLEKPGHIIRVRVACMISCGATTAAKGDINNNSEKVLFTNGKEISVPENKSRNEFQVVFDGRYVATLTVSDECIEICRAGTDIEEHTHSLNDIVYISQDGEEMRRFGFGLRDGTFWEFQTTSIFRATEITKLIAYRFGARL